MSKAHGKSPFVVAGDDLVVALGKQHAPQAIDGHAFNRVQIGMRESDVRLIQLVLAMPQHQQVMLRNRLEEQIGHMVPRAFLGEEDDNG